MGKIQKIREQKKIEEIGLNIESVRLLPVQPDNPA